MMSCGGTSMVSNRKLMRYSVSMGQKTKFTPPLLASGTSLPSRNTTPRSHSLITYSEFLIQIRATKTTNAIPNNPIFMPSSSPSFVALFRTFCGALRVGRLHVQRQPLDLSHLHGTSRGYILLGKRAPILSVNSNHPFDASVQSSCRDSLFAQHFFGAGGLFPLA